MVVVVVGSREDGVEPAPVAAATGSTEDEVVLGWVVDGSVILGNGG